MEFKGKITSSFVGSCLYTKELVVTSIGEYWILKDIRTLRNGKVSYILQSEDCKYCLPITREMLYDHTDIRV